jgi:hypothetical protein
MTGRSHRQFGFPVQSKIGSSKSKSISDGEEAIGQ